jgi:hypothetical protein
MKKVIAVLTTVILSLAAAQECAAQRELPGPIPAAEGPPDLFMHMWFANRSPSENDGWLLRLGSASPGRRIGFGTISHFAWGAFDSGSLLVRMSQSELCRHHLLVNPGVALVSDLFVGSTPLGAVSVGLQWLQSGALPLHSRVAVYWYPMEGIELTIGLDLLRGWDWGLDLLF